MIRFEEEDSDPYTQILIYENDEVKSGSMVAFSLEEFNSWLNMRDFPHTVKEAEYLLGEYDDLTNKRAHTYIARVLEEIHNEEEKSYRDRYMNLKRRGYSEHDIHVKLFPEEYDFILDDRVDAKSRSQGVNPMNQEYIEKVNARRESGGFAPLDSAGEAKNSQTIEWCKSQDKGASS